MARGAWQRTALLASLVAEPYRDRDQMPEPYTAADFNPFLAGLRKSEKAALLEYDPKILQQLQDAGTIG